METAVVWVVCNNDNQIPYSLGKPIEWKLEGLGSDYSKDFVSSVPYSLGKPIEWKLCRSAGCHRKNLLFPYSLGKPIEWKRQIINRFSIKSASSLLARETN